MKKSISFLCCILLLTAVAQAQSTRYGQNSIGVSVGWQQVKFLDDLASPLLYKANAAPFVGLNYTHSSLRSYFKVNVSGGTGTADPERFGPRNFLARWSDKDSFQYQISSMFAHANVEATYLRKLNPASGGPWGYWLGGTINEQAYYADEVGNMPWLINATEFSPSFKMDYQPGSRHNFSVKVDLAGVAFLSRTLYGLFAKSDKDNNVVSFLKHSTRFTSVHQYQKINMELNYNYHVSGRIALGTTYGLKWLHYSYPRSLRAADSRFHVNINYSLHPQKL